ncbi:12065_t:CDS:1, partial [Acaulospora colombiana]
SVDVDVDVLKDVMNIGGLKNVSPAKFVVSQLLLHLEHVKFML